MQGLKKLFGPPNSEENADPGPPSIQLETAASAISSGVQTEAEGVVSGQIGGTGTSCTSGDSTNEDQEQQEQGCGSGAGQPAPARK
jgi:hypothetical protein